MNWRRHWLTAVIFGGGVLLAVGLSIHAMITQPRKIEYFYMSKGYGGPVFHLDPNCKKGLVYFEASQVFNASYPDYCFCSSCISPRELKQIHDSVEFRHSVVTPVENE